MRRLYLQRIFLTLLFVTCCVLLMLPSVLKGSFRANDDGHERLINHRIFTPQNHPHPQQKNAQHATRPWFMSSGMRQPRPETRHGPKLHLWPHEDSGDRIVEQLMYVPLGYDAVRNSSSPPLKRILLYFGLSGWSKLPLGQRVFQRDQCPVDTCEISTDVKVAEKADLLLFKDRFTRPSHRRSPDQVWLLFLLECPLHTQSFTHLAGIFNWTATYRHDSDIVAPYEKFVSYEGAPNPLPPINYAAGKKGKVAWFVSNCAARNRRLQYARELAKYIPVHIYGKCGRHRCPRSQANRCFDMLNKEYKFYLAFENSNCKDYITEKFFVNGLGHDVIPIVMGARPEDYTRAAPAHSYIHVEEFSSPASLAAYLHVLDKNDTLYNEYFRWKFTGEFVNTHFWCRLCSMLHAPPVPKVYVDLQAWWASRGTCTSDTWRQVAVAVTSSQDPDK